MPKIPAATSRRSLRLSLVLSAVVLAACSKGGAEPGPGAGGPPPAPVTVQSVKTADVQVVFEYVGQLAGAREVEVRARVSGILAKRHFTEGSAVRKGQLLFTLDAAPFQAALAKADAAVASSEARLNQATRTLDRTKQLG
jgi:membrane fusion protein (multidrug efflux system)